MSWGWFDEYNLKDFGKYVNDPGELHVGGFWNYGGPDPALWDDFDSLWNIWYDSNLDHWHNDPDIIYGDKFVARNAWRESKGKRPLTPQEFYDIEGLDYGDKGGGDKKDIIKDDEGRDYKDIIKDIEDVVSGYQDELGDLGDFEYSDWLSLEGLQDLLGDIGGLGEWNEETGEWVANEDLLDRPELEKVGAENEFFNRYKYDPEKYARKLGKLGKLLEQGPDISAGQNYAAEMLGYDDWTDLNADIGNARQRMMDVSFDQPLSDTQVRSIERNIAQMEDEMMQTVEAMGLESYGRSLAAAAGFRGEVSNYRLQEEMAYAEYNLTKAFQESEAYSKQFESLAGQAGELAAQYQNAALGFMMGAIDGYSQLMTQMADLYGKEIKRVGEANQATIGLYKADIAALTGHADMVYNSIMAHLGIYDREYAGYAEDFNRVLIKLDLALKPYALELESYFADEAISEGKRERASEDLENILSPILTLIGTVLGAVIGAPAGGAAVGDILADLLKRLGIEEEETA